MSATSTSVPPAITSSLEEPMIVSLPAPPLSAGWTASLVRPVASTVSSPSRASIVSFWPRSGF